MKKRMISLVMAICMLCGLALNGIALPASAATQTLANIEETIATENDVPTDWDNYNANSDNSFYRPTYSIEENVSGGEGKVLKMYRESASSGLSGKIYSFTATKKVTLEYRVKSAVTSGSNACFILPSFVYSDGTTSPAVLTARSNAFLSEGGTIGVTSAKQVAMSSPNADTWYTVKCEVDLTLNTFKLSFDGTEVTFTAAQAQKAYTLKTDSQITGIVVGCNTSAKGTVYLDDLTVTYEAETTEDPEITFYGERLELGNTLNMQFLFKNDQRDNWTGYTAKVTMNDVSTTYAFDENEWGTYSDDTGNYHTIYFTGINARNMSDEITVVIYDAEGEVVSEIFTTSINEYGNELKADNPDDEELNEVVDALLAYGAAAKTYFE